MSIFCKHKWQLVSENTTKSKAEHIEENGIVGKFSGGELLNRRFIQLLKCDKCGKLKRFVEHI